MCVYLFAPSRGQPLCFSLWTYPFAKRFSQLKNGSYKLKTFPKFPIFSYDYVNQTHAIKIYSLPYRKDTLNMNSVFLDFTQSKFKDHLLIYTDGSQNVSHVGSALWCPNKRFKEIFKLPPKTSIYLAEDFAILRAVQYMRNVHDFNKFLIWTDSLGALKAINVVSP